MLGPFVPGYPKIYLRPPNQRRVQQGNRGGSALFRHGAGTLPPDGGNISRQTSGKIPVNRKGDPPHALPPFLYCFVTTRDVRDATGVSLPSGGIPSTILFREGHPGQHRTALVKGGPGSSIKNGSHA